MKVLIIVEHDHQEANNHILPIITAAQQISDDITAWVIGHQCSGAANQVARLPGIQQVFITDHAAYQHQLAENTASLIAKHTDEFTHIIAAASSFGKSLMPRIAALRDVIQLSDVTGIIDPQTFIRPIYAGNAFITVKSHEPQHVLTIRSIAFSPLVISDHQQTAPVHAINDTIENHTSCFVNETLTVSERPELTQAKIVVSGGRALQSKENFSLIEQLADKLNAAIGASRAAVDAGYIANDYQVGQTGKIVAPDLYIAIGISGAIQHIAGMKDSKIIVAINQDADAPIFQIADYGLIGDLFTIIPELIEKLNLH